MHLCIVTVYNTENCGSFLQAYALFKVLENMGHKVSFLYRDRAHTTHSFYAHVKEFIVKCLKLDAKSACYVWKRYMNYRYAQQCFTEIKQGEEVFSTIDCIILGSDTIWNFHSPYFNRNKDIYTGGRFIGKRCIAYAASAADTPIEFFEQDKEIKDNIKKLDAISVRDTDTWKMVKTLTAREVPIVCDPTILIEREIFDGLAPEIPDKNYIILYHFDKVSDKKKENILKLKREKNCQLISFGEYRSWCDKNVAYDPYFFISYIMNADFVLTDTFHGTVFSILYERDFAEYGGKKKKIADLINFAGLKKTLAYEDTSLMQIFKEGLDYSKTRYRIAELRNRSMQFLKENLMGKEK